MEYEIVNDTDALGILAGFIGIAMFVGVIAYAITSFATFLLFKKAGHPQAWGAWVPFYQTYLMLKFGGQKSLWFWVYLGSVLIAAIPVIGSIASFAASVMFYIAYVYALIFINKSFGKIDDVVLWTLFAVFLFPIWAIVIGMSKDIEYQRADGPLFLNKEGFPPEPW